MIKHYIKGYPCKLGSGDTIVLGRIIGESGNGTWGSVNGEKAFSLPLFSTPQGIKIKTGVFHLYDLEDKDWKKLTNLEKEESNPYGGKLSAEEIEVGNEIAKIPNPELVIVFDKTGQETLSEFEIYLN